MENKSVPVPTDAELEILQVLWSKYPETVRYVNEQINIKRAAEDQVGYTTTLKQMQVMLDKGLLDREIVERNHLYAPAVEREITQTQVVEELANRAFNGSPYSLAMHALGNGRTSAEELARLKALIQQLEAEQQSEDCND